jgi:hypothetical protein
MGVARVLERQQQARAMGETILSVVDRGATHEQVAARIAASIVSARSGSKRALVEALAR